MIFFSDKQNYILLAILPFLVVGAVSVDAESLLPAWIQNTALWYGQGNISEQEFLNALQYLVDDKILLLSEKEKTDCFDMPKDIPQFFASCIIQEKMLK